MNNICIYLWQKVIQPSPRKRQSSSWKLNLTNINTAKTLLPSSALRSKTRTAITLQYHSKSPNHIIMFVIYVPYRPHAKAQVVVALCPKLEGHRFNSWRGQWIFQLTESFRLHYGPGFDPANRTPPWVKNGWHVWPTSPPSLSRPFKKHGSFNISQFYGPPQFVTGIAYLLHYSFHILDTIIHKSATITK